MLLSSFMHAAVFSDALLASRGMCYNKYHQTLRPLLCSLAKLCIQLIFKEFRGGHRKEDDRGQRGA